MSFDSCRYTLGVIGAAAILVGCSGSQPALPSNASLRQTIPLRDKYRILYSFDGDYGVGGPNGGPPLAAPVLDADGNLYGPAGGGTGNSSDCSGPCGVVFKMTRGSNGKWRESVVMNFTSWLTHAVPDSPVAFDNRGNLYGSLRFNIGRNWIYKLTPGKGGWGFTVIRPNYDDDTGGVVPDSAGNLYAYLGQPKNYCGGVGELSLRPRGWVYTDLHRFCNKKGNSPGGYDPRAPFSWDAKGNLYGTDYFGGRRRTGLTGGTAFEMTRAQNGTWTYHVLHRFGALKKDGLNPWGGLVVDKSGSVYGTTINGGPHGFGEIFKLTPSGGGEWKDTLVYGFPEVSLGAFPWGNLVFDASGNLYGVANGGKKCGVDFCGEVFKLTPQSSGHWKYGVLHGFSGPDGAFPYGVVIDSDGHLFGTTLGGGTYNYGVVFEINSGSVAAEGTQ